MLNAIKKPFQLYVKSQEVQLNWIRNHPIQWLALNGVIAAGAFAYIQYKDRQLQTEFEETFEMAETINETPQTV